MYKSRFKFTVTTVTRMLFDQYALAGAVVLIALILTFTLNFIKKDSIAFGVNDRQEKVTILQNNTVVLRGTKQQCLVGIEVDASKLKTPFTLSAIEFKIEGSEAILAKQIKNAMLWYTASSNNFDPYQQLGDTIKYIDKFPFKIDINKYLRRGKNYFWLAVDIQENAVPGTVIDVDCYGVSVEGHYILPGETNPEGSMKISSNKAFYSQSNGNVNDVSIWNSQRDGRGSPAGNLSTGNISLICQKGHSINSTNLITTGYIVLEKGSYLKSQNEIDCGRLIVQSGAIFEQSAEMISPEHLRSLEVMNGGTYIHTNAGRLAGQQHFFQSASNQIFFNYGEKTFIRTPEKWGKVEFDAGVKEAVDISGAFRFIQSDLVLKKTGPLKFSQTDSVEIFGNLILHDGYISGNSGGYSTAWIINGNLIMYNGVFRDLSEDALIKSSSSITLSGNFEILGGTFMFGGGQSSSIHFVKNTVITGWKQLASDVQLPHIFIEPGRAIIIQDRGIQGLGEGRIFEVKNDASIYCGNYTISGDGIFKLNENANLYIGSQDGINSNKLKGNILTGDRIFNSAANYIYYQSSSPQQTGVFNTIPTETSVGNLIILKDGINQVVILNNNITVQGEFKEVKGTLDRNGKTLRLMHMSGSKSEERGSIYTNTETGKKIRKR